MEGQGSMTSTQPCRLYEGMTEVEEPKAGLDCPTLVLLCANRTCS